MRVLDGETAERPKGARHFEMGDHDHHAEEERDRVDVDGVKRLLEAKGAEGDHRRPAEEGDAGPVEAQARNAARRDAQIGQDEDGQRGEGGRSHSPGAPSDTTFAGTDARASPLRVSGMNKRKTRQATPAAAARKRNEAE